jgi:hypothetical protein
VSLHNPGLRAAHGVGPDTAAQLLVTAGGNPERMRTEASFAALCGAAPVPASSGRTNRHRLSRGGDRAANASLYRIALVRMSSDSRRHPSHRLRTSRHRHQARETARRTLPLSQAAGHSGRPAGVAGGFKCQVAGPRYVRTAVSPSGFPRSDTTRGALHVGCESSGSRAAGSQRICPSSRVRTVRLCPVAVPASGVVGVEGGHDFGRDADIYFPSDSNDPQARGRLMVTTGDPIAPCATA